jgi:TRAP-type mannitol/chloroaromatic compound transport system permease small subunit
MSDSAASTLGTARTAGLYLRRGGGIAIVFALFFWVLFANAGLLSSLLGFFTSSVDSLAGADRFAASMRQSLVPLVPHTYLAGAICLLIGTALDPLGFTLDIDIVNEKFGNICNWLVPLACVVSAANAMTRYAYDVSSNAWLEMQWYMWAIIVMFGAAYTLKRNEHVRVDLFYMTLSRRGQLWVDILGTLVFLLPTCAILAWLSWPFFSQSYNVLEHSSNAGGLIRWPIKLVMPVGFTLVALQGLSELIKRVAFLNNIPVASLEAHYERPTQ